MIHCLRLVIAATFVFGGFALTAQEPAGKTFVAGNGATCKEMSDGGCMLYYYRVVTFSADSVRVSHRVEASCVPAEREAGYEHMYDHLAKTYKWTLSDGIIQLENSTEFESFTLENGLLAGYRDRNGTKEKWVFSEETP